MLGAATVIADFTLGGEDSQVAARLLDVGPDGKETLVDRGLWRPANGGPTRQVFQLHPNGWHFDAGHVPKLELIAADGVDPDPIGLLSYGRPSNGQQPVTVSDLELRIPVVEKPGALDGLVKSPADKFLPDGYELAKDFADLGHPTATLAGKKLKVKGKKATAQIACPAAFAACNDGKVVVTAKIKKPKKHSHGAGKPAKAKVIARGKFDGVAGGSKVNVKLKLSKQATKALKRKPKLKAKVEVSSAETDRTATAKATLKGKKKKHHKGGKGGK
jgi:hypothetical protein